MSASRKRTALLVAAFAFANGACARTPTVAPARAPTAQFGKISGAPSAKGWFHPERASEVVAVEAGVAGDRIASLVEVPEAACVVLIARGTDTIEDLDLLAYGEDGAVLGMDEGPDKTPALLVCPPHPARLYVAARIAAGHGLVALGVERVAPQDAERAAATYHARHRQGEPDSRLASWPGLAERIAAHREHLGGTWQDVRRVAVPLDARIPTLVSATVEENRCLHALVLASDELSHVELSALDQNGQVLGRATALGRDRSLVVCSPLQVPVTFEFRPQGGRGVAVLVLSQSEPGSSSEIDDAVRVDVYPSGTLDETRQKHAARLDGLGYAKAKLLKTGTLEPGRLDSATFALPKGCSRVDVLAGAPMRAMSARLWAADDSLIATSDDRAAPVLFACSSGGQVRLDTESLARPGQYSVELRAEPDAPVTLQSYPLAASRLLARMIERGLIQNSAQAGKITHHSLSPERLETEAVLVPVGRCIELTLAVGASATGAEVRLVNSDSGEELALARGTTVASARACANDTLHVRAELRVAAGQSDGLSATHLLTPAR